MSLDNLQIAIGHLREKLALDKVTIEKLKDENKELREDLTEITKDRDLWEKLAAERLNRILVE